MYVFVAKMSDLYFNGVKNGSYILSENHAQLFHLMISDQGELIRDLKKKGFKLYQLKEVEEGQRM